MSVLTTNPVPCPFPRTGAQQRGPGYMNGWMDEGWPGFASNKNSWLCVCISVCLTCLSRKVGKGDTGKDVGMATPGDSREKAGFWRTPQSLHLAVRSIHMELPQCRSQFLRPATERELKRFWENPNMFPFNFRLS